MKITHIGTIIFIFLSITACNLSKDRVVYTIQNEDDTYSTDAIYNHPYKDFKSCQKELHILKKEALDEYKARLNDTSLYGYDILEYKTNNRNKKYKGPPMPKYKCVEHKESEHERNKIETIYGNNSNEYKQYKKWFPN